MRRDFHISYDYLKDLPTDRDLKAFALYLHLKTRYTNSVIYNWDITQVSKRLGVSPYILSKYVQVLKEMGLCFRTGPHMTFTSFKHLYEPTGKRVWVNIGHTYQRTVQNLRDALVMKKLERQKFIVDLHCNRLSMPWRKAKKFFKKFPECNNSKVISSYRALANLLGTSPSTAHRLTKDMEKRGFFQLKTDFSVVDASYKNNLIPRYTPEGFLIKRKGMLLLVRGTEFIL